MAPEHDPETASLQHYPGRQREHGEALSLLGRRGAGWGGGVWSRAGLACPPLEHTVPAGPAQAPLEQQPLSQATHSMFSSQSSKCCHHDPWERLLLHKSAPKGLCSLSGICHWVSPKKDKRIRVTQSKRLLFLIMVCGFFGFFFF